MTAAVLHNAPAVPAPPLDATAEMAVAHLESTWAVVEADLERNPGWTRDPGVTARNTCSSFAFPSGERLSDDGSREVVWRAPATADSDAVVADLRQAFAAADLEFFYDPSSRERGLLLHANDSFGYEFTLERAAAAFLLRGETTCLYGADRSGTG